MKIESIHIGKVQAISFNGETVHSGITKEAVEKKVFVTKTGIIGDEQENLKVHGGINKAVYGYPAEYYEFWKAQRLDREFYPGLFGENLSVTGMFEDQLCVGDQFKMGEVILSVTTPRMPCNKLGIKLQDKSFIKEFLQAKRSGFYFKVLQEGEIEAGMEIQKIGADGHGLTITELVELQSTRKDDVELLKKAIESPSLQDDWKQDFLERLERL